MIRTQWIILIAICFLLKSEDSNSQSDSSISENVIRLSRFKKNQELSTYYILPGEKVKCKFIRGTKVLGRITNITANTFDIKNQTFSYDSLTGIGKFKKGYPLLLGLGIAAGLTILVTGNAIKLSSVALVSAGELVVILKFAPYAGTIDLKRCKCQMDIIDLKYYLLDESRIGRRRK